MISHYSHSPESGSRQISAVNLSLKNRKTGVQLIKFSIVGCLNTGISYFIFLALYKIFDVHYLAASVLAYSGGLLNSFILNKKWTFGAEGSLIQVQFVKFILVNSIALILNLVTLKLLVEDIGMIPEIAQIVAIGFSTMANFVGNKVWTFQSSRAG
jgi:putative flippase GtrA